MPSFPISPTSSCERRSVGVMSETNLVVGKKTFRMRWLGSISVSSATNSTRLLHSSQCSPLCGGQSGQEEIFHDRAPIYREQDIVPSPGYGPGRRFPHLDRITVPSAMTTSYAHSAGSMYVVPFQTLNESRAFDI